MKNMKRSLALSMFLHMLPILLFFFLGGGDTSNGDKNKGKGQEQQAGDILPKPNDKDTPTEIELVKLDGIKKPKVVPHEKDDCIEFFGGIGIMHGFNNVITSAPSGYPAANSGIKPGDRVISPIELIRGEIGTEVEVSYENENGIHTVKLIRDKICTSGVHDIPTNKVEP